MHKYNTFRVFGLSMARIITARFTKSLAFHFFLHVNLIKQEINEGSELINHEWVQTIGSAEKSSALNFCRFHNFILARQWASTGSDVTEINIFHCSSSHSFRHRLLLVNIQSLNLIFGQILNSTRVPI